MKLLLIAAAVVAVAFAGPTRFIQPGGAGPAPVIDIDPSEVISVGPAIIGDFESPISVGPAIVDQESPISVGPALVEEDSPISVGPAIIDPPVSAPVPVYDSPLVQVIVNVNSGKPAQKPKPEIVPTPVIVVEQPEESESVVVAPIELPEIEPTPVQVVEQPVAPEPVIVAPIEVAPVINLPDELN